jgi:hypothetical protein
VAAVRSKGLEEGRKGGYQEEEDRQDIEIKKKKARTTIDIPPER